MTTDYDAVGGQRAQSVRSGRRGALIGLALSASLMACVIKGLNQCAQDGAVH